MKYRSADRKKEKNQHEIKLILSKSPNDVEKIKGVFKYFQSLRVKDLSKASHAYKNFLCMDEAKKIMHKRYFSATNNVADVISYSTKSDTLNSTIKWVAITLGYFEKELNEFVKLKKDFDKSLLLSNFDESLTIIQNIENL